MGKRMKKKKQEGKFSNVLDWTLDVLELGWYAIRGIAYLIAKIFD